MVCFLQYCKRRQCGGHFVVYIGRAGLYAAVKAIVKAWPALENLKRVLLETNKWGPPTKECGGAGDDGDDGDEDEEDEATTTDDAASGKNNYLLDLTARDIGNVACTKQKHTAILSPTVRVWRMSNVCVFCSGSASSMHEPTRIASPQSS